MAMRVYGELPYCHGTGTRDDPWIIDSLDGLLTLIENPPTEHTNYTFYISMVDDIDFNNYTGKECPPINFGAGNYFLYGNGHHIKNHYVTNTSSIIVPYNYQNIYSLEIHDTHFDNMINLSEKKSVIGMSADNFERRHMYLTNSTFTIYTTTSHAIITNANLYSDDISITRDVSTSNTKPGVGVTSFSSITKTHIHLEMDCPLYIDTESNEYRPATHYSNNSIFTLTNMHLCFVTGHINIKSMVRAKNTTMDSAPLYILTPWSTSLSTSQFYVIGMKMVLFDVSLTCTDSSGINVKYTPIRYIPPETSVDSELDIQVYEYSKFNLMTINKDIIDSRFILEPKAIFKKYSGTNLVKVETMHYNMLTDIQIHDQKFLTDIGFIPGLL